MKKIFLMTFSLLCTLILCAKEYRYNAEIIKHVSHYQINTNKLSKRDTVVIQINNREGDRYSAVGIFYSKGDKVSISSACIEDADGKLVRKLKNSEIENVSYVPNSTLYADYFLKYFKLQHNTYPYRVVYIYTVTYSQFWWVASLDLSNVKTNVRDYKVIVETNQEIKYKQSNINEPVITTGDNNYTKYVWSFNYTPEKYETNSPIKSSIAPQLTVIPMNFKYGETGNWKDWLSFGDWIVKLNRGRDQLTDSEKIKIDKLLEGVNDNWEKARILYEYMQDYTRYINVSVKVGGLQTYPASYVSVNKYGDCKALSNYYQAMLKYVGIESFYTIINLNGQVDDIDENFASPEFNHIIIIIPIGKDTIYQECTSKNNPFAYIHTSIQGRKALLVEEGKSRLINIPEMKNEDVLCTRKISIINLKQNYAEMDFKYRAYRFELYSELMDGINKNDRESFLQRSLLNNSSYRLMESALKKDDRNSTVLNVTAKCSIDEKHKNYGNNLILNSFPLSLPTLENVDVRTKEFKLDYPTYNKDTISYYLEGMEIVKIPNNEKTESPFGHYHLSFENKDGSLIVYKSMLLKKGLYSLEEYKELHKFIKQIKLIENKNYYLETK